MAETTPHTDVAIEVQNLSKVFYLQHNPSYSLKSKVINMFRPNRRSHKEAFKVLDDVSLTIKKGEAVALLGHNGSGKSTLLRHIAGIYKPTNGRVLTQGLVTPMIELSTGFHEELTGLENIFLNASMYGTDNEKTASLLEDIITFSGLQDFIDTPVKNYSSGMLMRLAYSVAAHLQPDILLADEILAVGDAEFQQKCFDHIESMLAKGLTLVLVTHSDEQAKQFCKRFIRLDHGKIVEEGTY